MDNKKSFFTAFAGAQKRSRLRKAGEHRREPKGLSRGIWFSDPFARAKACPE